MLSEDCHSQFIKAATEQATTNDAATEYEKVAACLYPIIFINQDIQEKNHVHKTPARAFIPPSAAAG